MTDVAEFSQGKRNRIVEKMYIIWGLSGFVEIWRLTAESAKYAERKSINTKNMRN